MRSLECGNDCNENGNQNAKTMETMMETRMELRMEQTMMDVLDVPKGADGAHANERKWISRRRLLRGVVSRQDRGRSHCQRRWPSMAMLLLACVLSSQAFFGGVANGRVLCRGMMASAFEMSLNRYSHPRLPGRHSHSTRPDAALRSPSRFATGLALSPPAVQDRPQARATYVDPEQLKQLHSTTDIVALIESYNLEGFQRRNGNRGICLCPFHDDNSPSLNIDGDRGIYKCFACGAGGNAIQFVREYSKLHDTQEISFLDAVELINEDFNAGPSIQIHRGASGAHSKLSQEQRDEMAARKERHLQINKAAAHYFANNLATELAAGGARYHLRERGIGVATTLSYTIGFAKDAYNSDDGVRRDWAKADSLVNHLRGLGFTPPEILHSGLAFRINSDKNKNRNKGQNNLNNNNNFNKNDSNGKPQLRKPGSGSNANDPAATKQLPVAYGDLMDRFRGRLMVPIYDTTGKEVLGFGGRILDAKLSSSLMQSTKYKNQPKYLNSPESAIFQKKNILFNSHSASEAMKEKLQLHKIRSQLDHDQPAKTKSKRAASADGEKPCVIIVEGYMDAITMHQEGVSNVVASMGTALTSEQLSAAAALVASRKQPGTVILCLDNDAAGILAMERACNSGTLFAVTDSNPFAAFQIATLPDNCKDPAEFLEQKARAMPAASKKKASTPADAFQKQVIDKAKDWMDWYLERLLSVYDKDAPPNTAGSVGDIFENVAKFLSNIKNPAERTKRAYHSATIMAAHLSDDSDSAASRTILVQLESDLVEQSSRIANGKHRIQQRSTAGHRGGTFSRGMSSWDEDELEKLSTKALKKIAPGLVPNRAKPSQSRIVATSQRGQRQQIQPSQPYSSKAQPIQRVPPQSMQQANPNQRRFTLKKQKPVEIAPGVPIKGVNDRRWLGWEKEMPKIKTVRGQMAKALFFDSPDYKGKSILTEVAHQAGYNQLALPKAAAGQSQSQKGGLATVAAAQADAVSLASEGETSLLNLMVDFPSSRKALRMTIEMNQALASTTNGTPRRSELLWTSPERAWLFQRMLEYDGVQGNLTSTKDNESLKFREYLMGLEDAPEGAFLLEVDALIDVESQAADKEAAVNAEVVADGDGDEDNGNEDFSPLDGDVEELDLENVILTGLKPMDLETGTGEIVVSTGDDSDEEIEITSPQNQSQQEQEVSNADDELTLSSKERRTLAAFGGYEADGRAESMDPSVLYDMNEQAMASIEREKSKRSIMQSDDMRAAPTADDERAKSISRYPSHQFSAPQHQERALDDVDDGPSRLLSAEREEMMKSVKEEQDERKASAIQHVPVLTQPLRSIQLKSGQKMGSLDGFFFRKRDSLGALHQMMTANTKTADLAVQEIFATLLVQTARQEMDVAKAEFDVRSEKEERVKQILKSEEVMKMNAEELEKLRELKEKLSKATRETFRPIQSMSLSIYKLEQSKKKITEELVVMRSSMQTAREGHISRSENDKLHTKINNHMKDAKKWSLVPMDEDDSYEDCMERLADDWGDAYFDHSEVRSPADVRGQLEQPIE